MTGTDIRFERYIELIEDRNGRLLDLGCGDGAFASFLSDGYNYYGVEILPENVEAAKRKGLKVICSDLNYSLPFPSGAFDIVVAGEIIEHLPNVSNSLMEANRVLKDDGIFIGSTRNAGNLTRYLEREIIKPDQAYRPPPHGHLYLFNRTRLRALLELNGFKVTKFTGTTFLPVSKYTLRLNKWLGKKLSRLSVGLVFRAEKTSCSRWDFTAGRMMKKREADGFFSLSPDDVSPPPHAPPSEANG